MGFGKRKRKTRFRRKHFIKASEAIIGTLNKLGLTDQAYRLRIFLAWQKAVGENIAANSEPHSFSRGILKIKVYSPTWQNEITFLKTEIIKNVNAQFRKNVVTEIRILSGTLQKKEIQQYQPLTPNEQEKSEAHKTSQTIKDSQVREVFANFMSKAKAYRKRQ